MINSELGNIIQNITKKTSIKLRNTNRSMGKLESIFGWTSRQMK